MNNATRFNYALNEGQQTGAGGTLNVPEAYSPDTFATFIFHGNTNQFLALSTSPAFAWLFAANIGLINLDCPRNRSRPGLTIARRIL